MMTRRSIFLAGAASVMLAVAATSAPAAVTALPTQSATQALSSNDIAARASAGLNALTTMRGRFLQVDYLGQEVGGDIYLARPGRVRFEYDAPHPALIVADGATVAHHDRELNTTDRAPLRRTPLHPILKENINLAADLSLTDVSMEGGLAFLTARDDSGEMDGSVTLVFDAGTWDLLGWSVEDALGQVTQVRLEAVERNVAIDDARFILREPRRRR